jgi:hypothetical protein
MRSTTATVIPLKTTIMILLIFIVIPLEELLLIVVRFAGPNDPESYGSGSVIFW